MDDEEKRKLPRPDDPVEQGIPSQASPLVMQRRKITAGFDERQKQLFNEAVIAILTVDMPAEKLTEVLNKAYFSGARLPKDARHRGHANC